MCRPYLFRSLSVRLAVLLYRWPNNLSNFYANLSSGLLFSEIGSVTDITSLMAIINLCLQFRTSWSILDELFTVEKFNSVLHLWFLWRSMHFDGRKWNSAHNVCVFLSTWILTQKFVQWGDPCVKIGALITVLCLRK
jgi:hypothetical protein